MSKIIIGGEEHEVPPLNFKALKKLYPVVKKMKLVSQEQAEADPDLAMEALDATVEILSIALARSPTPLTVDQIEEKLLANEIPALQPALMEILSQNGLQATAPPPGEPEGAAVKPTPEVSPSTEILTA